MKKQKKLNFKARDMTPQKNVTGGKHHRRAQVSHELGLVDRADARAGLFGRSPQ
jgi:hypothetical protein